MSTGHPEQYTGEATAGSGGAMTDDVGVITGDLTLITSARPDGQADIRVQYTGADEWYTLTGSPATVPTGNLETFHAAVLAAIEEGGAAAVPR
ncbi:hypothetical protein [Streptomyces sp. NPDC091212]|uniref:hypothetical protein n=1 Tax=Streptomyces sp. NPDC091212 TaxID=3155191 RepID=UPI00342E0525